MDMAVVNQIKGSDKIESIRIEGDTAPLLAAQAERVTEWNRALGA
jgi:peptidyl-prolyl cis-trans isomerase B (cyclophilin B)